jgi:hypothetical protein
MDCQKLIMYGILLLVGVYVLRDVCGVKIPFIEGMENIGVPTNITQPANLQGELLNNPSPPVNLQTVDSSNSTPNAASNSPSDMQMPQGGQLSAAEPSGNEFNLPIQGIETAPSNCYPQNTLTPQDLLPEGQASQIQQFNEGVPEVGEGILKGVNYLDAGFHVGVNTVGQSLRNANLNLRAEPPNPRTQVSPWMMSTIDPDLSRRPLSDGDCNLLSGQTP